MPVTQDNNVLNLHVTRPRPEPARFATRSIYVSVDDLLTSRFLLRHTCFADFEALLSASEFRPDQVAALEKTTDPVWEAFIQRISRFGTWGAMLKDARGEWILRRLGLCFDG